MENTQIRSDDRLCQARIKLGQSAEMQKQIVSLRESRALLGQKQRMREERATRISFQFKTILNQMKQAQEDVFIAQERNMKLLRLRLQYSQISSRQSWERFPQEEDIGSNFQHEKHQLSVNQEEAREIDQNRSTSESDCAGSSLRISSIIERTKSLHINSRTAANSGDSPLGSQLLPSHSDAQAQTPQSFPKVVLCDVSEDPIAEQQQHAEKLFHSDAWAGTNYPTMEESRASTRMMVGVESRAKDSTLSDGVMKELETCDLNHHQTELEKDQLLTALCISSVNIDQHDVGIKSSPLLLDGSSSFIMSNEETSDKTEFEKLNTFEQKNAFLKIEKNDFSPDIAAEHVVYGQDGEASKTSNNAVLSSKQVEEEKPYDTDETNFVTSDSIEQTEAIRKKENLRNLITSWSPDEKLSVLTTLKNTMFLWDDHLSQFGCWPELEILLSSIVAAKDSQLKLFEYLDAQEDISRPLTCCGAAYELLKAYSPEKLLPFKFIADLFASDDWNSRSRYTLTFEHLKVFQHEHSQFWQMLIQHSICVKDLGLGTLNEVASTLSEIFCPREILVDLSPEIGLKVRENILEFLNGAFKGCKTPTQSILEETESDSETLDYNYIIPVQKGSPCDLKPLQVYKVEAAQTSVRDVLVSDGLDLSMLRYDFFDIGTGYKSEGSARGKGSKKGLFSSIGSLVRTPFKLWRSRGMPKGTQSIDDGFVRLLSPKRPVLRAR